MSNGNGSPRHTRGPRRGRDCANESGYEPWNGRAGVLADVQLALAYLAGAPCRARHRGGWVWRRLRDFAADVMTPHGLAARLQLPWRLIDVPDADPWLVDAVAALAPECVAQLERETPRAEAYIWRGRVDACQEAAV